MNKELEKILTLLYNTNFSKELEDYSIDEKKIDWIKLKFQRIMRKIDKSEFIIISELFFILMCYQFVGFSIKSEEKQKIFKYILALYEPKSGFYPFHLKFLELKQKNVKPPIYSTFYAILMMKLLAISSEKFEEMSKNIVKWLISLKNGCFFYNLEWSNTKFDNDIYIKSEYKIIRYRSETELLSNLYFISILFQILNSENFEVPNNLFKESVEWIFQNFNHLKYLSSKFYAYRFLQSFQNKIENEINRETLKKFLLAHFQEESYPLGGSSNYLFDNVKIDEHAFSRMRTESDTQYSFIFSTFYNLILIKQLNLKLPENIIKGINNFLTEIENCNFKLNYRIRDYNVNFGPDFTSQEMLHFLLIPLTLSKIK